MKNFITTQDVEATIVLQISLILSYNNKGRMECVCGGEGDN